MYVFNSSFSSAFCHQDSVLICWGRYEGGGEKSVFVLEVLTVLQKEWAYIDLGNSFTQRMIEALGVYKSVKGGTVEERK